VKQKWSAFDFGLLIIAIGAFSIFCISRWAIIPILLGLLIVILGRFITIKKI
jgi:hypothetical protein